MKNNVYKGEFHDDERWYQVFLNGKIFDHSSSLQVCNHSPDGFSWGYYGSGPSQLALAILLEEIGDKAVDFYMSFKDEIIAKCQHEGFTLTSAQVAEWVAKHNELDEIEDARGIVTRLCAEGQMSTPRSKTD
jgi:hypothetical protein